MEAVFESNSVKGKMGCTIQERLWIKSRVWYQTLSYCPTTPRQRMGDGNLLLRDREYRWGLEFGERLSDLGGETPERDLKECFSQKHSCISTKGSAKCWHETKQDISSLNLLWDRLSEESSWDADLEGETIVLDLLTTSDLDLVTTLLELFDLSGFTFLGLSFSAELPTSTKLL